MRKRRGIMRRLADRSGLDYRYDIVKLFIEQGKVKTLEGVFKYIPKTIVANDIGLRGNAMTTAIRDPTRFTCMQLFRMSQLFDIEPKVFWDMVYTHWMESTAVERRPYKKRVKGEMPI